MSILAQTKGTILKIEEGQENATLCCLEEELLELRFRAPEIEEAFVDLVAECQGRDKAPTAPSSPSLTTSSQRPHGQLTSPKSSNATNTPASASTGEAPCTDPGSEDFFGDGPEQDSDEDGSGSDTEAFSELSDPGGTEVVFVKEGVAVWPSRSERIMGRLSLVKQHCVLFLAWLPYSHGTLQEDGTFHVTPYKDKVAESTGQDRTMYAVHPIPLSDVKAIRKHTPTLGWHYVVVVLINGVTLPPLYFHNGGIKALIAMLKQHAFLIKSAEDPNTYLVNDTADPLQRSLTCLEMRDILIGAPPTNSSVTFAPVTGPVSWTWAEPPDPSWSSLSATIGDALSKIVQGVKGTTSWFGGLDIPPYMGEAYEPSTAQSTTARQPSTGVQLACCEFGAVMCDPSRADSAGPAGVGPSCSSFGVNSRNGVSSPSGNGTATSAASHPTVELTPIGLGGTLGSGDLGPSRSQQDNASASTSTSVGDFELIDGSCGEDVRPGGRRRVRPPPLSQEEWSSMFDAEGRLVNEPAFRERVFVSGCEPEVRREAWKFLLGLYPAGSTAAERSMVLAELRKEYPALRNQWMTISAGQESRFGKWRERKLRVDKDVRRTDRAHPFFAAERGPNLKALRNILLTYTMYNFDLGYCQGMSDLASPLLVVMRGDEAEAFWCFSALMEKLAGNFDKDQQGMHAQLLALRKLVQVLDPQLHSFLDRKDCLNYYFCFRWLLIHFKREFKFDEVLRLWEAEWACARTRHLHLYLAAAVLVHHRRAILEADLDFDGLLKFCIDLSGKLELESLLQLGEALVMYAGEAGRECLAGLTV